MKISVLIPAYNSASTIQATLDSVLQQTLPPHEILVMDDGSTDNTSLLLNSYAPRVTILRQLNKGVAVARNALCAQATGDLIAFLDSDDLLHPRYLEIQSNLYTKHPRAAAFFTGHITFPEYGVCDWSNVSPNDDTPEVEVMGPLSFFRRYAAAPGYFGMSWVCVPKGVLDRVGKECFQLTVAEDLYFCNLLALEGDIVYYPAPLSGYRIRRESLSRDRLRLTNHEVKAFEGLEPHYKGASHSALYRSFCEAFASKRRLYAKALLSVGRKPEARAQLTSALAGSARLSDAAKSLALLVSTYIPARLQRKRSIVYREWRVDPAHCDTDATLS